VTDKGYYTNSFHLDVARKVTPFEKIQFEKAFADSAVGGHITYVELPNMRHNLKALERIWDYAIEHVPYFGTNTPVDSCGLCGFMGEAHATAEGFTCPQCGNHDSASLSVTRRVCGYLGSPNARPFNAGKQKEVIRRVKHLAEQTA
jgi:anaerobic ribonucleoside-triphosphate reductase